MNKELLDEVKLFIGSYLIPAYEAFYVDSKLRRDFDKVIDEAEDNYKEMEQQHIHAAGTTVGKDIDTCALCGLDLRDIIHKRKNSGYDK